MRKKSKRGERYLVAQSVEPDELKNIFGTDGQEIGIRGNNIPYGVFGLVWKKFGVTIAGSEAVASKVEQELVWGIDAEESGVTQELDAGFYIEQWSFSEILEEHYTPMDHTDQDELHHVYKEARLFAKDFIKRIIKKHTEIVTPKEGLFDKKDV